MPEHHIDPLKGEAENRALLIRSLREDGRFNTAKGLRDCRIEWRAAGPRADAAIVFHVLDMKAFRGNNAKELWDAVMKATPPSVHVASMTICPREPDSLDEPITLEAGGESLAHELYARLAGWHQDEAASVVANAELSVRWDGIRRRAAVVLAIGEQQHDAVRRDTHSGRERWKTIEGRLEMVLWHLLSDTVDLRIVVKDAPAASLVVDGGKEAGLNQCSFKAELAIEHDELRFRSPAEVAIYDELKRRQLLFFPNAACVLGGLDAMKREPDFLICHKGKWGVLEVMGATYHADAIKDHERARLFQKHGLLCVHFYPARRCLEAPAAVVDEFLALLESY